MNKDENNATEYVYTYICVSLPFSLLLNNGSKHIYVENKKEYVKIKFTLKRI